MRLTSAVGITVPVGLFGEVSRISLVRGVIGAQRGVDVDAEVVVPRHGDDPGVLELGVEGVHRERRREVDQLVAGIEVGPHQQVDQLVGAVPEDQALGGNAGVLGQGGSRCALGGVRIDAVAGEGAQHLLDQRRGPVRVLVGVELDDALDRAPEPLRQELGVVRTEVLLDLGDGAANVASVQTSGWMLIKLPQADFDRRCVGVQALGVRDGDG